MIQPKTLSGTIDLDLPEFDSPPDDPMPLLLQWVDTALRLGVVEPFNVALATSGTDGRPSNRMILAKTFDVDGMTFASNASSAKGRELAANPYGAGTIYWRETRQQLRLSGRIDRLPDPESDAIFAARPVRSQAAAVSSHQSDILEDEPAFMASFARLAAEGRPLPRPQGWCGYRLVPDSLEFWHGSVDRMHRRLAYSRGATGWSHVRLQP